MAHLGRAWWHAGIVVAALLGASCSSSGNAGSDGTGGNGQSAGGSGAVGGSSVAGTSGQGGISAAIQEQRSTLPQSTTPDISTADYGQFIANTNAFGLDLLQKILPSADNVFFSPVSTALALGMTYAGARGNTAVEMEAAFHSNLPSATFHAGMNQLLLDLGSRNVAPYTTERGTKSLTLLPANAAWVQSGYQLSGGYLDTLGTNYGAGIKLLDFIRDPAGSTAAINQWVDQETRDKIPELIPAGSISTDTRLVLTNAIYFYGSWATQFDPQTSADGTFHTLGGSDVTVRMIGDGRHIPYVEGDGYQMIDLGYEGGKLAMTMLLPAAGRFAEIRGGVTAPWLEQAHAAMTTSAEVVLRLPKFRFSWGTASLSTALMGLGMTDAFDSSRADFSGMEPKRELFISDVLHQAFVALDENGTEAAAATAVIMDTSSLPTSTKYFTADRPFLVFIRDATGVILFAGQVGNPAA
jgi:serpin B